MENTFFLTETKYMCKNNIPIYVYPNESLHSFCLCLYIKAGLIYETLEMIGSTHLWEHLLFRNLNQLHDGKLYQKLDRLGLTFDAYTYKEFVQIKIKGASDSFEEAATLLSMIFEPMNIHYKELQLEKKRIKAEIREDGEKTSIDYFSQQFVWENTSLVHSIAGSAKTIDKIGVRALSKIHRDILSESNLFIYLTGAVNKEDINYLATCIEEYSLSQDVSPRTNSIAIPTNFFNRRAFVAVKNSYYHYMRFSFDLDMSQYTKAELDILYDILFSSYTSLLFNELSEKNGLIYDFDARQECYRNIGNLHFSFEVQEKDIFRGLESIITILNHMKYSLQDEIIYVLPEYTKNAELILDENEELNWTMAYEKYIMDGSYENIQERKGLYENISVERIMEMARKIFISDNAVLTVKTNKKKFDSKMARQLLLLLDTNHELLV